MWRRFGPSRLIRLLAVSDRAALHRSLAHVLEWDFDRVVPGHGDVLEHGGPNALRLAWLQ
jgi:glyoxylase-like metal-dependent hydrolase (beta-lactamase superfamily II)